MTSTEFIRKEKNKRNEKTFLRSKYDTEVAAALKCLGVQDLVSPQNPAEDTDFFVRLYEALTVNILEKQYRARFFFWADVFLSSSKIPGYVVASFIKRLSRMSIKAPPECLMTLLPFICNLLMRHPTLMILRDRVNEFIGSIESANQVMTMDYLIFKDPYNDRENDFKQSKALESCLWEVTPLRYHWHPAVAEAAKFLGDDKLPNIECDLSSVLELTHEDMKEYFEENDDDDEEEDEDFDDLHEGDDDQDEDGEDSEEHDED